MKRTFFVLAILSILFLSGCSVLSTHSADKAKTIAISGNVVLQVPVVADLDVRNAKITEEYTTTTKVSAKNMAALVNEAKNNALAQAVSKHSADVLVEPNYEVHITGSGFKSLIKIVVTGYPATYKNFRNATKDDMELIVDTSKNK